MPARQTVPRLFWEVPNDLAKVTGLTRRVSTRRSHFGYCLNVRCHLPVFTDVTADMKIVSEAESTKSRGS